MNEEIWDDAIIVALGSNLSGEYGSSAAALEWGLVGFSEIGLYVKAKSSIWRSAAWPNPDEPSYMNAVAVVETDASPRKILTALHDLEVRAGRRRDVIHAPRVLDLDLIAFGRETMATPELLLPHPRAAERRFVMGPLAEIAPRWRHPLSGLTAAELAANASVGRDASPL